MYVVIIKVLLLYTTIPRREGEQWCIYRDAKRRGIYLALFTDPEGDSFFSIYQISWIKLKKKVTFCKLKRHVVGTLFTIYKHFGDFVKCILRFCCKFSMKIISYLTSEHRGAKVRRSLGICLYECFIYRTNFVFRKCLETRHHLGSGCKTVNSQGYSVLREPIKTREKYHSLLW